MRAVVKIVLFLVIMLGAAWVALWWYAQGRMQAGMTNWISQTSAQGSVQVSYDSITRGTSPLAAVVTLVNPKMTVTTVPGQQPVVVALASFAWRIDAADPMVMHIDLPSQVNVNTDKGNAAITFDNAAVSEQLDPQAVFNPDIYPFRGADASAANINLLASDGSLLVLHIDNFTAHGTLSQAGGNGLTTLSSTYTLDGLALSPLLTKIASVPFDGRITHLGLTVSVVGPPPQYWQDLIKQFNAVPPSDEAAQQKVLVQGMHQWATQNGSASTNLNLIVGPSTLNADAAVAFDANVQPNGTADVTANHLDAFSSALTSAYPQLQNDVNEAQAMLSPYLSSDTADGQNLAIHLVYGSGTVNVNGQKVSDLPPVDWDTLENPPPPAQVAPGDGSGAAVTPPAPAAAPAPAMPGTSK